VARPATRAARPAAAAARHGGKEQRRKGWRRGRHTWWQGAMVKRPATQGRRARRKAQERQGRPRKGVAPSARRKGGKARHAGGAPGGETQRSEGRWHRLTRGVHSVIIDPAAMAVYGGNANAEAHVANAVASEGPETDRSMASEM